MRRLTTVLALALLAPLAAAGETESPAGPARRVMPEDPAWRDLAEGVRGRLPVAADFTESRWFSFKKTPTVLKGEVRVSREHGLSLHYLVPEEETVVIDDRGMLVRSAAGDAILPSDPWASAANAALLNALRLDLPALAGAFELYGARTGAAWRLVLVPKDGALRRTLGRISIEGEGACVRRIELRRSTAQRVEILVAPPRTAAAFTGEELRRFFRSP
jgi:hypothetical protein